MAVEIRHFVGGKLTAGSSGRFGPVYNPATGEQSGEVALANAARFASGALSDDLSVALATRPAG